VRAFMTGEEEVASKVESSMRIKVVKRRRP
jgi:hypothetical protein